MCSHFDSINVGLHFFGHQWVICLLGCNLKQIVSDTIWDLMFLRGHKVIFQFLLALMHSMRAQLMTLEFDGALKFIEEQPKFLVDVQTLIQNSELPLFKVTNTELSDMREECR